VAITVVVVAVIAAMTSVLRKSTRTDGSSIDFL
jgi:hypothetical protein